MEVKNFIDHSIAELHELCLIDQPQFVLLNSAGLQSLSEILNYYFQDNSFRTLPGIDNKMEGELIIFSEKLIEKEKQRLTPEDLFTKEFRKNNDFFVPLKINWDELEEFKRAFLDAWIRYSLDWYQDADQKDFFRNKFGDNVDAKSFYETAILHPLSETKISSLPENIASSLKYNRSAFMKLYEATKILSEPIDILRFFIFYEFFFDLFDTKYKSILEYVKRENVPYAYLVEHIVCSSKYFDRPRGMKDINMMRFVSIFNTDPYGFGILENLFRMTRKNYDELNNETNSFAEKWSRATIQVLKALGFKENYRSMKNWNEHELTKNLVADINAREKLYLPESFYALLFNELFDLKFELREFVEGDKVVSGYVNMIGSNK